MKINFETTESCLKAIIKDAKQNLCLMCGSGDEDVSAGCWTQGESPNDTTRYLPGFSTRLWNIAHDLRLAYVQKTLCDQCANGHHFTNTLTIFKRYGVK